MKVDLDKIRTRVKEAMEYAEDDYGDTLNAIISISEKYDMCIAGSILEKDGDNIFNTSYLVCSGVITGKYRKMHIYGTENEIFTKGNIGFPVFSWRGVNLGLLICFDWIFPEAMRTLALKGAQIILHSANLVLPYCQDAMRTRAIENRVFVATANRTGDEKRGEYHFHFTGKSQIVSPDSTLLAGMNDKEEGIRWVDIDPGDALNKNITPYNNIFKDRRKEFYFK